MHKYKSSGQKFGFGKENSQKLWVILTKAAHTFLKQLFYAYQFFDVSSVTSNHNNMTKSIQFSQGSGKITNPRISKKRIILKYSEFTTWTRRTQFIVLQ